MLYPHRSKQRSSHTIAFISHQRQQVLIRAGWECNNSQRIHVPRNCIPLFTCDNLIKQFTSDKLVWGNKILKPNLWRYLNTYTITKDFTRQDCTEKFFIHACFWIVPDENINKIPEFAPFFKSSATLWNSLKIKKSLYKSI